MCKLHICVTSKKEEIWSLGEFLLTKKAFSLKKNPRPPSAAVKNVPFLIPFPKFPPKSIEKVQKSTKKYAHIQKMPENDQKVQKKYKKVTERTSPPPGPPRK